MRMNAGNRGRPAHVLAALLLGAYAANVVIGKGVMSFGWQLPHAGDVAEFLTVLAAMISFVTGLLLNDEAAMPPE